MRANVLESMFYQHTNNNSITPNRLPGKLEQQMVCIKRMNGPNIQS